MWNRSENQVEVLFVRHGRTPANEEHRYLGRTEEDLSPRGAEELRENQKKHLYRQAGVLFASPMKRCIETAQILYPGKKPFLVPEWKEMDFGLFEGKNYQELNGNPEYQAWIDSNGTLPFPQGESREAFIKRCVDGLERIVREYPQFFGEKDEKCICCIVHGGTMMALLSHFYGGEYFDYQTKNGDGYLCRMSLSEGQIRFTQIKRIKSGRTEL